MFQCDLRYAVGPNTNPKLTALAVISHAKMAVMTKSKRRRRCARSEEESRRGVSRARAAEEMTMTNTIARSKAGWDTAW